MGNKKAGAEMKCKISFRELNEEDLSIECPFLPEADEFEMSLQAIAHEVKELAGVTDLSAHEGNDLTLTVQDLDVKTLKAELKPLLQHHFQYLRISAIEAL